MDQQEILAAIAAGDSAYGLLMERAPQLKRRWMRMCKTMQDFLAEAQKEFPNAQYYTASGGFHLMLGNPHANDRNQTPQQDLIALSGDRVYVGDGDF